MAKLFKAGGTIRVSRFVKITGNSTVSEAEASNRVIGISQAGGRTPPIPDVTTDPAEAAQSGEQLQVFQLGEECLLRVGSGGCAAGDALKSDADGDGITCASGSDTWYGAIALEAASEGELALVQVYVGNV